MIRFPLQTGDILYGCGVDVAYPYVSANNFPAISLDVWGGLPAPVSVSPNGHNLVFAGAPLSAPAGAVLTYRATNPSGAPLTPGWADIPYILGFSVAHASSKELRFLFWSEN